MPFEFFVSVFVLFEFLLTPALTRGRSPHLTSRLSGAARCYAAISIVA